MSAPNYKTLYDIETAVETAWQTILSAQTPPIAAFTQRETADLPAERVDIYFTLGAWTGRWGVTNEPSTDHTGQNVLAHAGWSYTLRFEVNSNRAREASGRHAQMCAVIRSLAQFYQAGLPASVLPYHGLPSLNELSAPPGVNVADDLDISPLTFTGLVVIRSNGWPPAGTTV